ncbi:MAG: hypothetical protein IKJ16_00590 [Agathobacter sp.]|nr:hypothetical protein [Agathobacter sp.]
MFGSKKNKKNEKINDFFDCMNQQRLDFESSIDEVEERRKRIERDLHQLEKNTDKVCDNTKLNIKEEIETIRGIDASSKDWDLAFKEYRQLEERVKTQVKEMTDLVEANKHFTSPAKQLSDVSKSMNAAARTYEMQLDEVTKYGKSMGTLALDAANEAKKLGDNGKDILVVAEAMQQIALSYENALKNMSKEAVDVRAKIAELEETATRLITLMKDNNVSTAKLLMKSREMEDFMKKSSIRDFSEDLASTRDKVIRIRNLDEEIAKCCERNKIQLSDIQEDMQSQKKKILEMESDLLYLLDSAEEKMRETHRG